MDKFIDMRDLNEIRADYESDEHWKLRRMFIERHMMEYPRNRLLCLAQIFCNVNLLGCTYDKDLMNTVKEMGAGLMEEILQIKTEMIFNVLKKRRIHFQSFGLMRAQLSILEKKDDPLILLNRLTSRLKYKWEVKYMEIGKSILFVNNVNILEGIFPPWTDYNVKNFVAAAALAVLSRENAEVQLKDKTYELWSTNESPSDSYMSYLVRELKKAVKVMPKNGSPFERLGIGLQTVRMTLKYSAERGTGWEQRITISALNVELASAVLRKGDCTRNRERERKENLAAAIIQKLASDFRLIPNETKYMLN
ncbi:unnamed protein product [Thelazia callipaeda]|uniref:XRN2-binding (XTBD) domain-containing protein n=1 Tax=Thelazia callipaeda TaxID=103827 RepID=A0A158RBF4_THECL|nr:unnamed protein product [Thelazia callipaeda]